MAGTDTIENIEAANIFNAGDVVEISGYYLCVPCGDKKFFEKGQTFPKCMACMESDKFKGDKFFDNLETWELVKESVS